MPYDLNYIDSGFVAIFKGEVTIEELNEANGEIQGHSNFDDHNYQIVDLLAADLSTVTEEDTEFPAVTDSVASVSRWNVKVALVVTEEHALSIVNSYVRYAQQLTPRWQFAVFSTRGDALQWAKYRR